MSDDLLHQAEMYFRLHLHAVMPLHQALVEALCQAETVPLELATVLEDIGQTYVGLANMLNVELDRRGMLTLDPEADEVAEARIDAFIGATVAQLGTITLREGSTIDGRKAIEAFPVATNALRTALLVAMATDGPAVKALDTGQRLSRRSHGRSGRRSEPQHVTRTGLG